MKTIVILSGKGGVGKSSVVASLAVLLAKKKKIIAADCDVDTPNLALCLGLSYMKFSWKNIETSEKAELIRKKCLRCKKCFQNCNFNAISWDEKHNVPLFNKLLCEGCGVCSLVCDSKAIRLKKVVNGKIGISKTDYGFKIVSGQLRIGESGSGEIVSIVRKKLLDLKRKEGFDFALIDSAAGIGCPVIASVTGSDYVVAVTEPTPAALNDLKRVLKVVDHFKIPYGIIINKCSMNESFCRKIEEFAQKKGVPVLGKIPYDKKFVEALVDLIPIVIYEKGYEELFSNILAKLNYLLDYKF